MNISITEKLNISLSRGSQYYSEWNQKNGLTDYLSLIMYELLIRKRLTQKELAELGDLPKQSINKGIKILKDQGYLELIVDSHDKRVKFCQLTAAGHKYAKEKMQPLFSLENQTAEKMGAAKMQQLLK